MVHVVGFRELRARSREEASGAAELYAIYVQPVWGTGRRPRR